MSKLTVVNHSRVVVSLHSAALPAATAPAPSVWDAGAMTPSSSSSSSSSLPAPAGGNSSGSSQAPYYFTIGSPEAFERSLEADQDALGVPLSQRVAVQYKSSSSWAEWALSLAPTALLVGVIVWSTRKAMPGGAGGGGPGGIFGVGKSKAKMFKCVAALRASPPRACTTVRLTRVRLYLPCAATRPTSPSSSRTSPAWTRPRSRSWNS